MSANEKSNTIVLGAEAARIPSRDAVSVIIKEIAEELTFSDDESQINDDTRLDGYFGPDFDFGQLLFAIAERLCIQFHPRDADFLLGLTLTDDAEEWKLLYAPLATFGRLTDLVHKRLEHRPVQAVTTLGVTSKSAGAFRWLEWAAKQIDETVKPFGPSTPIDERFRGSHLEQLWTRCRMIASGRLPKLKLSVGQQITGPWLGRLTVIVMIASAVFPLIITVLTSPPASFLECLQLIIPLAVFGLVISMPALLTLVLVVIVIRAVTGALAPPQGLLPKDLVTFADLARVISGERGGWCHACEYELTGVQSTKCPECGAAREDQRRQGCVE